MDELSEIERDAEQAARTLAMLGHRLADAGPDERRLREPALDAGAAAARVLAYLRELRGAGDGAALAHPDRWIAWRDWYPPAGGGWQRRGWVRVNDLGRSGHRQSVRGDPGE